MLQINVIKNLLILFTIFNLFINSNVCATQTDIKIDPTEIFESPMPLTLEHDSPEYFLSDAYQNILYKANTLRGLHEQAKIFNNSIFYFTDRINSRNQDNFIKIADDLKGNLRRLPEILGSYFDSHIERLEFRMDLAKLDQQLYKQQAVKCSLDHPSFPQGVKIALNSLVGKVYTITRQQGGEEIAADIGSGILAHLNSEAKNKPANLSKGIKLNGVFTCAHIFESNTRDPLIGMYFVSNESLDPQTSLPLNANNLPLNNHQELLDFLKTNDNSFKIKTYTIRSRSDKKLKFYLNNKLSKTQPRFSSNEDLVFARFLKRKGKRYKRYDHASIVDFSMINEGPSKKEFKKKKPYFAIGYPGCPHYDIRDLEKEEYYPLLDDIGYSPLFVTSALCRKAKSLEKRRPYFMEGKIIHKAPTARGMSGGPLIKIIEVDPPTIKVFGCITATDDDKEMGCY